jgi:hypothetical protein
MGAINHKALNTNRGNNYFELALYLVTSVCLVYYLKTDLFPALRFSILFFIALTMLFANAFGFYGQYLFNPQNS